MTMVMVVMMVVVMMMINYLMAQRFSRHPVLPTVLREQLAGTCCTKARPSSKTLRGVAGGGLLP